MTYDLLAKIKKRDKLYLEVHMTSPNSKINKLKLTELENKAKEERKLKLEAKATYYNLLFSKYRNDIRKTEPMLSTNPKYKNNFRHISM